MVQKWYLHRYISYEIKNGKNNFVVFGSIGELKHTIEVSDPEPNFFKTQYSAYGISYVVKPLPDRVYPPPEKHDSIIKPVFKKICQVGLIVKNVDETIKIFNDQYGIGPWIIIELGSDTVNDMTVMGKRQDYRLKLAIAKIGNIDLELIEPKDEKSIYYDFLKNHGEGFHHIAYEVEDFSKVMKHFEKLSVKVSTSGRWHGKHMWVYMDAEDDLKHPVELNYTEPGFIFPDPEDRYP